MVNKKSLPVSSRNKYQASSSILTLSALAESLGRHLQGERSATRYLQRHGVSLEGKIAPESQPKQKTSKPINEMNTVAIQNEIENADFSFPVLTASHKQLTDSTQESSKQDQSEDNELRGPAFQPHDDTPKQPRIYQKNPVEPISQVVARIIQAVRTQQPVGRIDAAKLVANTAQQQIVNDIPLLKKGAIPKQLIIYVDRSAQTAGFDDELLGIAQQVAQALPNTQVSIIVLPEQCRGDWYWLNAFEPSQGDIALPSAGEPALVLTRLTAYSHSDWRYLLKRLAKQQSPVYWLSTLFALPGNVKSDLPGDVIKWGKVNRHSEQLVQDRLFWLYALCWSCRIVTGAMVRELIQQAQLPTGAESEFWLHSPFAYVAGADIGVLRSVSQSQREQMQQQFAAMLRLHSPFALQNTQEQKNATLTTFNQIIEKHLAGISESVLHEQRMHVSLLANWQAPKLAESEAFFQKLGKQIQHSELANNQLASNELTNQVASFLSDTLIQYGNTIQTASSKLKQTLTLTSVYLMQHSEFDQVPGAIMEQVQRRLSGLNAQQKTELVTIVQQHNKGKINVAAVIRERAGNSFPIQALGELQNTANTPLLLKTRSEMHSESEPETKQFVKPVAAENIKNASAITLPEASDIILQSQFEALAITKRSSKDFYWAKRLSVTNHSVVAETDEFVVAWNGKAQPSEKNGSASGRFTEQLTHKYALVSVVFHEQQGCVIGVKQSAPEWLITVKPRLDRYGVLVVLADKNIKFNMRYLAPSTFLMGSPQKEDFREKYEYQHPVKITQSFWLSETAITNELWESVMGTSSDGLSSIEMRHHPVVNVSWSDCDEFCKKMSKFWKGIYLDLPSEAQWEFACRAGSLSAYSLLPNESIVEIRQMMNCDNQKGGTCTVDSYASNDWGLKQMHGNVNEWCADDRRPYKPELVINPCQDVERTPARAIRGGGWRDIHSKCRSAARRALGKDQKQKDVGFRIAIIEQQNFPDWI